MCRFLHKAVFYVLLLTLVTETVTNFLLKQESMMALFEKQEKEKDLSGEEEKFVDQVLEYVIGSLKIVYIIPQKINFQSSLYSALPEIPPELALLDLRLHLTIPNF